MSAAVVLDEAEKPSWPSLVGTGGSDGNLDFTNNFMQQLGHLFDLTSEEGPPRGTAHSQLTNALWNSPSRDLSPAAVGQYLPGSAGGANSSTGLESGNLLNSWDFILMMEGTLLFSARATRRFAPQEIVRASAPFAVRSHAAGHASPGNEDTQRGEQWMPVWSRPAAATDVTSLFAEAKVQLGRQTAFRPVDVARAISRLGVARGIESFTRFGYCERNGQSTLAVALGRISVRHHSRAGLIDDLAPWLDRLQTAARSKNASARLTQTERRLSDNIFNALTHDDSPERWQAVLRAAVRIEELQSSGTGLSAGPIPQLRPAWLTAVDDGTAEFSLARCLGSACGDYSRNGTAVDSIRFHWLPLEPGQRKFKTSDQRLVIDPRVVMRGHELLTDCASVVERRLIEAGRTGQRRLRLVAAPGCSAQPADITTFLSGALDLSKIYEIARALMAINWASSTALQTEHPKHGTAAAEHISPPEPWLMLRLASLAWPLSQTMNIPAESGLVRRLLAGGITSAVDIAGRRLRSVGIRPPVQTAFADAQTARLWAAALAFPIDHGSAWRAVAILDPSMKGSSNG